MRFLLLVLLSRLPGAQNAPKEPLKLEVPKCAPKIKLMIPRSFEAPPKTQDFFIRKPDQRSADLNACAVLSRETLLPPAPKAPLREQVLALISGLELSKFEGTVAAWKGKPVPMARYEGRLRSQAISGRMAWLPLDPGTVILHVWGDPISERAINEDWEAILSNVSGPEAEVPLRKRSPGRWWFAKISGVLGLFLIWVTVIAMRSYLLEQLGGIAILAYVFPPIGIVYALLNYQTFPRTSISFLAGMALFGLMFLMGG